MITSHQSGRVRVKTRSQAATTVSADLMRRSKDVGALSPGHYGDMIAVAGDPLRNIRLLEDVKGVIKGGAVVKTPL